MSFFYNGSTAVFIFFVLSGYVLSIKFFREGDSDGIRRLFIGRYLRLAIPITVTTLLSWAFLRLGFFQNQGIPLNKWVLQFYKSDVSFTGALWAGFVESVLTGKNPLNFVVWTMKIEFFGSLLVFSNCLLLKGIRNKLYLYLIEAFILVYLLGDTGYFYVCFLVGMMIANYALPKTPIFISAILFASAVYLGGFHFGSYSYSAIMGFPNNLHGFSTNKTMVFYTLSAILFLYIAIYNDIFSKFLSGKIGAYLAKCSFMLYLVHSLVLCSLGVWLFQFCVEIGFNYTLSAASASISVLVCSLLAATWLSRIDAWSAKVARKFATIQVDNQ